MEAVIAFMRDQAPFWSWVAAAGGLGALAIWFLWRSQLDASRRLAEALIAERDAELAETRAALARRRVAAAAQTADRARAAVSDEVGRGAAPAALRVERVSQTDVTARYRAWALTQRLEAAAEALAAGRRIAPDALRAGLDAVSGPPAATEAIGEAADEAETLAVLASEPPAAGDSAAAQNAMRRIATLEAELRRFRAAAPAEARRAADQRARRREEVGALLHRNWLLEAELARLRPAAAAAGAATDAALASASESAAKARRLSAAVAADARARRWAGARRAPETEAAAPPREASAPPTAPALIAGPASAPAADLQAAVRARAEASALRARLWDIEWRERARAQRAADQAAGLAAGLAAELAQTQARLSDAERRAEERDAAQALLRQAEADRAALEQALAEARRTAGSLGGSAQAPEALAAPAAPDVPKDDPALDPVERAAARLIAEAVDPAWRTGAWIAAEPPGGADGLAPVDDLKSIASIGPRLEARLRSVGLHSYRQLAEADAAALAALDARLGLGGRVVAERWRTQARALTGAAALGSDAPRAQDAGAPSAAAADTAAGAAPAAAPRRVIGLGPDSA